MKFNGWRQISCLGVLGLGLLTAVLSDTTAVTAADFPEIRNTQPETEPFLTPQEALARLKLPEGFRATLFASEPEVNQPIAMAFDARGRLWIAENYTYAERPQGYDPTHADRIIVLEDSDGDGKAEKRTVFWDQAQQLTSIEVGFGGVWALCPPQLLFIPDANGDAVPDAAPIVVLDGFDVGAANKHNFANGLKWGPDGWLYGRVGITAPGKIGVPGAPAEQRADIGPSIWRFHPVTKAVEEVCTGTTNPWGHDWDANGELFFINTVIGHLWHAIPGAHFRRMFGADRNPYVYQVIEQTADHFHWDTAEAWNEAKKGVSSSTDQAGGGHAHCGMMIYLGDNWPQQYRGELMTLNMHGRRVNVDRLERQGATYVGKHEPDMIFSGDPYFRATEIAYGPDGGVYILDWSDIGECHENDGVHRTSGRIFKITYGQPTPPAQQNLEQLSSAELVKLHTSANEWPVRQARRLLQERAVSGTDLTAERQQLLKLLQSSDPITQQLRALWTLHVVGGTNRDLLQGLLAHPDEHMRVWAIRLLLELDPNDKSTAVKFTELAAKDSSGLVLVYLASALQKLPTDGRVALANQLVTRAEWATDPVYPLMVWYGIESLVAQHPEVGTQLAIATKIPLLRQFIARRITQELQTQPTGLTQLTKAVQKLTAADQQRDLLAGISSGLLGWRKVAAPAGWPELQKQLEASKDPQIQLLTREIAVVFGDGRAMDQLRQIALAADGDVATRRSAIASLVEARPDDLGQLLRQLLTDRDLSPEAIRGLATVNDAQTGQVLVDNFNRLYPAGREAAIQTLSTRPAFAATLLKAIDKGQVERAYVPIYLVRQYQGYDQPEIQELVTKLWPDLRPITADKKRRIEDLKHRLVAEELNQANLQHGRQLWEKTCSKCHTLFGEGAKIGPDLTGSQRHNLDYLLENVVDPSATLAPQFRLTTIAMDDGRVINGVVLGKTEQTWEVQTPTEKLTLRVAEIEESKQTTQSLMPEGLLDLLSPTDVRDILGYVMSPRQVPLVSE